MGGAGEETEEGGEQPLVSREIKRKSSQEAEEEVDKQMMETGDHLERTNRRMRDSMRPVRGGCVEKWRDEAVIEKVREEEVNMSRKNALL